jgi:hypothetical protein
MFTFKLNLVSIFLDFILPIIMFEFNLVLVWLFC